MQKVGGYIKGGPWHSACVESFFAHIPGWRVVFPSSADDAKGLIKAAARSDDPVIFLEHKGLYRRVQAKAPEPDADYVVPLGSGRIRHEGIDVTVVAWGSTVYHALEVARQLEQNGRSIEVLDLRSIVPLDEELIYRSVRKTNRVVIAHEDSLIMGFGADVAARIAGNCIDALDAPILRVAAKDSFVPSAPSLESLRNYTFDKPNARLFRSRPAVHRFFRRRISGPLQSRLSCGEMQAFPKPRSE